MNSNFHYHIDLNEDQTQQHPLLFSSLTSQLPSSSSSSSSSPTSTLSYLPFFNPPLDHGGYFHGDHSHVLLQPQEEVKTIVSNGGSCDHLTHKNETRIKLTIRKKEDRNYNQNHQMVGSKMMKNQTKMSKENDLEDDDRRRRTRDHAYHGVHGNVYNNKNNNGLIRVCSDCNTTKTPLWRSGPSGPKSLCNACGIRQRKARRAAAMAAAAAAGGEDAPPPPLKIKKIKRSMKNQNGENLDLKKKCKITADNSASPNAAASSTKFCLDDLAIVLSKSSAFQQVFPQDEKEAAILLMAMSYGMVRGGDYRI